MNREGQDSRLRGWPLARPETCGVGSLPFTTRREAVAFVRRHCAGVPFVPQLVKGRAGRLMIDEILRPARDELATLRNAARSVVSRDAVLLKHQLCGPATLQLARPAQKDDASVDAKDDASVAAAAARGLESRIGDHVRALRRECPSLPLLVVLDEPVLGSLRGAELAHAMTAIRRCLRSARKEGAFAGLHCCARFDPRIIDALDPDVLSFDAHQGLDATLRHRSLRAWLARGRALALGIVPTAPHWLAPATVARTIARTLVAAGYVPGRSPAPLLTGSCGFGLSSPAWTRRAHDALTAIADRLAEEFDRCS